MVGFVQVGELDTCLFLRGRTALSTTSVSDKALWPLHGFLDPLTPCFRVTVHLCQWFSSLFWGVLCSRLLFMSSYPGVTSVRVTFPFPEQKSVYFHSQAVGMKGNRKRTLISLRKQVAQLSPASWVLCRLPGCSCLSCKRGPARRELTEVFHSWTVPFCSRGRRLKHLLRHNKCRNGKGRSSWGPWFLI